MATPGRPRYMAVLILAPKKQAGISVSDPGQHYLVRKPMEEAPREVEHVEGPRDPGVHVFDANETADGDDGPVAAEAVA